ANIRAAKVLRRREMRLGPRAFMLLPCGRAGWRPDDRTSLPHEQPPRKSMRLQRAVHHVVALTPRADREGATADPLEAVLGVEPLGALVLAVDAEPEAGQATPAGLLERGRHQRR